MVGLGPFRGALPIGLHTGAVLGKLFGEVLDDSDPRPVEVLRPAGAGRLRSLPGGIRAQASPRFGSYAPWGGGLNISAAAVLAFVGAAGLGQGIYVRISLFLENQPLTLILAVLPMVAPLDR